MTASTAGTPDPGALIGSGKEAEVFAYGTEVLKLYRVRASKAAPFREAAILAAVEAIGLPAPRVSSVGAFHGRWGLIMSRVDGPSLAQTMAAHREQVPACLHRMATLQRRIHAEAGTGIPDLKARLSANIGRVARLGARRRYLLEALVAMPDGDRLCHGDFHPWNILGPASSPVVVDWLDACRGTPAADACRSWVLMRPTMSTEADAYLAAYAESSGTRPADILDWLPYVAAARLAEGVEAETDDLLRMAEAPESFRS